MGGGGLWCALLSPAAALGAAFCQNVLLGGALAVLAVALLVRAVCRCCHACCPLRRWSPLCAWVLLSILVLPLGATARYLVDDPAGAPRQYAEVTIVAPEQWAGYATMRWSSTPWWNWIRWLVSPGSPGGIPPFREQDLRLSGAGLSQRHSASFFRPGQALDGGLPAQRRGPVGTGFPIDHLHRTMAAGVFGALSPRCGGRSGAPRRWCCRYKESRPGSAAYRPNKTRTVPLTR